MSDTWSESIAKPFLRKLARENRRITRDLARTAGQQPKILIARNGGPLRTTAPPNVDHGLAQKYRCSVCHEERDIGVMHLCRAHRRLACADCFARGCCLGMLHLPLSVRTPTAYARLTETLDRKPLP